MQNGEAKEPFAKLSTLVEFNSFDYHRLVPDLIMLVNSIDPLAPYKVSEDLIFKQYLDH